MAIIGSGSHGVYGFSALSRMILHILTFLDNCKAASILYLEVN